MLHSSLHPISDEEEVSKLRDELYDLLKLRTACSRVLLFIICHLQFLCQITPLLPASQSPKTHGKIFLLPASIPLRHPENFSTVHHLDVSAVLRRSRSKLCNGPLPVVLFSSLVMAMMMPFYFGSNTVISPRLTASTLNSLAACSAGY